MKLITNYERMICESATFVDRLSNSTRSRTRTRPHATPTAPGHTALTHDTAHGTVVSVGRVSPRPRRTSSRSDPARGHRLSARERNTSHVETETNPDSSPRPPLRDGQRSTSSSTPSASGGRGTARPIGTRQTIRYRSANTCTQHAQQTCNIHIHIRMHMHMHTITRHPSKAMAKCGGDMK